MRGFALLLALTFSLAASTEDSVGKVTPPNSPADVKPRVDGTHADFIVVGTGAGGGPLAARLAEAGHSVLVLEAGKQSNKKDTSVPFMNSKAAEDPELQWDYWVDHLSPEMAKTTRVKAFEFLPNMQARTGTPSCTSNKPQDADEGTCSKNGHKLFKFNTPAQNEYKVCDAEAGCKQVKFEDMPRDKVLYPRASGVGGCTLHNVMILMMPPAADWDRLAAATGEERWADKHVRTVFKRMEDNSYAKMTAMRALDHADASGLFTSNKNDEQHGYRTDARADSAHPGTKEHWLFTDVFALNDLATGTLRSTASWLGKFLHGAQLKSLLALFTYKGLFNGGDINASPHENPGEEGAVFIPAGIKAGRRNLVFRRLNDARQGPARDNIRLLESAFVTKVVFEQERSKNKEEGEEGSTRPRAVGVRVALGDRLNAASPLFDRARAARSLKEAVTYKARYEVILAAGSFETPKLLTLSGVGPRDELERLGIPAVHASGGVGKNLQDRNENAVVMKYPRKFKLLRDG